MIFDCTDLFVPKVLHKPHSYPIWFTPEIKHKLNQIHSLRRRYRAHPTLNNMTKLSISEAHLQSIMSSAKSSYETHWLINLPPTTVTRSINALHHYPNSVPSLPVCAMAPESVSLAVKQPSYLMYISIQFI